MANVLVNNHPSHTTTTTSYFTTAHKKKKRSTHTHTYNIYTQIIQFYISVFALLTPPNNYVLI